MRSVPEVAWKLGLFLLIVCPVLYVAREAVLLGGVDQQNFLTKAVIYAAAFLPPVVSTMAIGAGVCVLVRIERHLRSAPEKV